MPRAPLRTASPTVLARSVCVCVTYLLYYTYVCVCVTHLLYYTYLLTNPYHERVYDTCTVLPIPTTTHTYYYTYLLLHIPTTTHTYCTHIRISHGAAPPQSPI